MAYKSLDVANYIVNYCYDRGKPTTNLKLQKIMYYVQAAFLVERVNQVAFEEPIVAWKYGPVIQNVYNNFKQYLNRPIDRVDTKVDISQLSIGPTGALVIGNVEYNPSDSIHENDRQLINKVVSAFIDVDAFKLVKETHKEAPWLQTPSSCPIEIGVMRNYFNIHRGRIYGKWN